MKGFGDLYKSEKKRNKKTKPYIKLINNAIGLHLKGNIEEAAKYYQKIIDQGYNDHRVFSNYGVILGGLGKLKEAENYARKAIEINPQFDDGYLNLGHLLINLEKLEEAEIYTRKAIELNPSCVEAHLNLGNILRNFGKLEEAGKHISKAIEIKPNNAEAYNNLGTILLDLGKLRDAEIAYRHAIKLNPNYSKAYYSLSRIKYSHKDSTWLHQLFSQNIVNSKLKTEQIDIYFARANILHNERKYEESARYLKIANDLQLTLYPSNAEGIINESKLLLIESDKKHTKKVENDNCPQSIFIVGMPRSGSSLIESIISMDNNVDDLGETTILKESFLDNEKDNQISTLAERYWRKIKDLNKPCHITTNKQLYNYPFSGIIAKEIPNAKIIHCYRNPLDNILSIYRTRFNRGNEYSSSLVDCARVYLDQEKIMSEYKKRFKSTIYELNYDSLVINTNQEIKSLISWLGWEWNNKYLSPHLNQRSVYTASSVQVRYPIHSKSIGGWKNYKDILRPAIEILTQIDKYQDINS